MADKEKKSIKKKEFSLESYKMSNKMNDNVKDKDLEYIQLSPAFQKVTGVSVIKGVVNMFRGYSNTGKSTALIETAIGCQRQGILPVIIDTENGWNWLHAREMGFDFEEVYGDVTNEETGEITQEVVNYEGFFIYINNDYLIENFGKVRSKDKNRDEATVEDVADFMNKLLNDQNKGELNIELCFLWDSVGTLSCDKAVESSSGNNQWTAGAIETAFKSLINYRIPASRKENKLFTNTLVVVNKIWFDAMQGAGVVMNKGGFAMQYATRLQFHFGGVQSAGVKKLIARADGREYIFGTQTKVNVEKNHVNGVSYKGDLVSTAHGFIMVDEIEDYKKKYKEFILSKLGVSLNSNIEFAEVEDNGTV